MKQLQLLAVASLLLGSSGLIGTAKADIFTVTGSTTGNDISHLNFTGTTFGPTSGDTLTLGSFDLGNGTHDYTGAIFNLAVTFTLPTGVSGSPVSANLTGSVQGNSGNVTIDFGGPTLFTFAQGSFDLTVNDVNISTSDGAVSLTGTLSNEQRSQTLSSVPEPFSVALLGSCIGILGLARRYRTVRS